MAGTFREWLIVLRGLDLLVALPLLVGGIALMIFGWRIWKGTVVLCFGIIGAFLGQMAAGSMSERIIYGVVGAVGLAVLNLKFARYGATLLGGMIGTVVILQCFSGLNLSNATYWTAAAACFVAFSALAQLNRRAVVVFVAAFLGGVLMVSGLGVCLMTAPTLYGYFMNLITDSSIALPFMLLVPTAMSCFFQSSELNRRNVEF